MMDQNPAGEAMAREGKGTAAAGEAGNSLPTDGESTTPTRWRLGAHP